MATQQTLLDQDIDTLFALRTNTCARCGASFQTSRPARLCALCAGPQATVGCPACGVEHRVPVLAPHKLCPPCLVDLDMTEAALRARLAQADAAYTEAATRLDADLAHADEADVARYQAALAQEAAWGPERFARNVAAAIAKGDGLSPLLRQLLAMRAADAAAGVETAAVWIGLGEVERARCETTH